MCWHFAYLYKLLITVSIAEKHSHDKNILLPATAMFMSARGGKAIFIFLRGDKNISIVGMADSKLDPSI